MAQKYTCLKSQGLKVNDKITVKVLRSGLSKHGKWITFVYTDTVYSKSKKKYVPLTQYNVFVTNVNDIDIVEEDIVQIKQIEGFKSGLNIGADGKEYRTITLFAKVEKVKDKKETLNINQMVGDIPTENLDFGVDSLDDFTIDEIDFD